MKTKSILPILLLASLGVMGQSKTPNWQKDSTIRISQTGIQLRSQSLEPSSMNFLTFNMKWLPKLNINKIDSIYIYVKKSQLRWVNDSTAVITK